MLVASHVADDVVGRQGDVAGLVETLSASDLVVEHHLSGCLCPACGVKILELVTISRVANSTCELLKREEERCVSYGFVLHVVHR